ncbi:hypothetical protein B0H13DRAFT_920466 [Mycena leptocephala]|nr:hypothetical protein B0H13DRAFT_920466 [Mycena leptocephala]
MLVVGAGPIRLRHRNRAPTKRVTLLHSSARLMPRFDGGGEGGEEEREWGMHGGRVSFFCFFSGLRTTRMRTRCPWNSSFLLLRLSSTFPFSPFRGTTMLTSSPTRIFSPQALRARNVHVVHVMLEARDRVDLSPASGSNRTGRVKTTVRTTAGRERGRQIGRWRQIWW